MQDNIKRTAFIPIGYDYQVLHGVLLLCEWLESPTRYQKIRFECTDREVAPQSLDDIVAVRGDAKQDYWQVKYTPNPEKNALSWDWLLYVEGGTARARSNLRKWFDALKNIDEASLGTAQLVTNRRPDREIEDNLATSDKLHFDTASSDVRARLVAALGSKANVDWLFSHLRIIHSDKNYLGLNNAVVSGLLRHTDAAGIERLKSRSRAWAWFENEPQPDGWISLEAIRSVISPYRPQPIPQDFTIPKGYRAPDAPFHDAFVIEVESGGDPIVTLCGPPGRGKSTYLSYVCEVLQDRNIPVIRHHYFLSPTDRTSDRFSPHIVRDSLLGQISRVHSHAGAKTEGDADLREALAVCAAYYKTEGKRFVVIIDGLDHVWRENSSDKKPLDDVFAQLLPAPNNMLLIVGTQPVADSQLPVRLLTHSPRPSWKVLPPMSAISVMSYLENQIQAGRLQARHERNSAEDIADGAHELHRLTGGHPLHVIYATEHLISRGDGLSKWSVEQLPGDLGKDAETYYRSLWLTLTHAQRDILILLAEFKFQWPSYAFISSRLLPSHAPTDLGAVEHLLHSTPAGLAPFHDSLVVFVKADPDFRDRVSVLTPRVEQWLSEEAPVRLRNIWLWSVQARLGNPDNLISGLTRDWIIDRLAEGYAIDIPIALLAEAETFAFDKRRYADAYRLRHLKTRLFNGPKFQISDATRLKVCSWQLAQDSSVLDEALAARHRMTVVEVAGLGVSLNNRGLAQEGAACGADALHRHRGDSRFAVDRHDSDQLGEVLYLGKVFGKLGTLDVQNITLKSGLNAGDRRLTVAFVSGAASRLDVAHLVALREKLRPSRKKVVEDAIIRVAAHCEAQIHRWSEFKTFVHSSIAGCWARLVDDPIEEIPCSPLLMNWSESSDRIPLERLTHEWFFKTVLTRLSAEGKFSWVPCSPSKTEYRAEVRGYLEAMTGFADKVAEAWCRKKPFGFSDFYDLFKDLPPPGKNKPNERYTHTEFCRTLVQIGIDCQVLSSAVGAPSRIDAAALRTVEHSSWFNLHYFRGMYAEMDVKVVTQDAAEAIVSHGHADLISRWAETNEHAETLLELCEISLSHDLPLAHEFCRLAWDYVLGYGNHKDPTILTLLEAIGYLADTAPDKCRAAINQVAPQVHHITDYTDGDETRHAHSYVDDLLAKLDRVSLAKKIAAHTSAGDWSYADHALAALFNADLSSPALELISQTGLPPDALSHLRQRAERGDAAATRLHQIARLHNGTDYEAAKESSNNESDSSLKAFQGKPEDYPPEAFDALLEAMRASGTYSGHSYLPRWYRYWSEKGRDSDLLRALEGRLLSNDHRDDVHHVLDQAFESSLKLDGNTKAFRFAVQAQKELGGWSDFYERSENTIQRLTRVAELYPERADEFISASCFAWLRRGTRVIPSDKLVFFLVKVGRLDEAIQLVQEMIAATQGDTRNLPLTTPSWAT